MSYASAKIRKATGASLRRRIERAGLSINEAADTARVSRSQLYDVLGGYKGCSVEWLSRVAEAAGTTAASVLKGVR